VSALDPNSGKQWNIGIETVHRIFWPKNRKSDISRFSRIGRTLANFVLIILITNKQVFFVLVTFVLQSYFDVVQLVL